MAYGCGVCVCMYLHTIVEGQEDERSFVPLKFTKGTIARPQNGEGTRGSQVEIVNSPVVLFQIISLPATIKLAV